MAFLERMARNILYVWHYAFWLGRFIKLTLGASTLKDIRILSIEFASVCNLSCKYCFLERNDRPKFLDIKIYEKLIKEVAGNSKYHIRTIEWPISGEFFVYPHWKQVVDITKKYWEEHPDFRPHIILNDNLMLFDEEKIGYILQSGIVHQIICSIDGHDPKSYEDMRPPAKFEKMRGNLYKLIEMNDELGHPVYIQINNGRDERSKDKPLSEEMSAMFVKTDEVTYWQPKFWNESFNAREMKFYPAKGFCAFVFNNVTLCSNGSIAKCCMDLKGATVYGDLSINALEEIWHSDARKRFLKLMFRNKRKDIPGCKTCSITYTNNDNRHNNVLRVLKRRLKPRRRVKSA